MKIEIRDAYGTMHCITSANPALLAEWIAETLDLLRPDHAFPATVQTWPMVGPPDFATTPFTTVQQIEAQLDRIIATRPATLRSAQPWEADWVADSRVLGRYERIQRPQDVIAFMRRQAEAAEELAVRTERM